MSRLDIDKTFKIIVIGDSKVGKTSIIHRYTDNTFSHSTLTTIGSDFKNKVITINNLVINLNIWDTAGQEIFRSLTSQYYKRASGILIVYDVSSRKSFEGLTVWLEDLKRNSEDEKVIKLLIGNKTDRERQVSYEQGKSFASRHNLNYLETSAFADVNISKAFEELAEIICSNHQSLMLAEPENQVDIRVTKKITLTRKPAKKSSCCKKAE